MKSDVSLDQTIGHCGLFDVRYLFFYIVPRMKIDESLRERSFAIHSIVRDSIEVANPQQHHSQTTSGILNLLEKSHSMRRS